jgi:hypothetical protein
MKRADIINPPAKLIPDQMYKALTQSRGQNEN